MRSGIFLVTSISALVVLCALAASVVRIPRKSVGPRPDICALA